MPFLFQILFLLYLCYSNEHTVAEDAKVGHGPKSRTKQTQTTVLLFGSLGDLAKRYLWPGFHSLYISKDKIRNKNDFLRIFATGRKLESEGNDKLQHILSTKLCNTKYEREECKEIVSHFSELSSYHRTKSENDYIQLSETIENEFKQKEVKERLRIFYLSVPPFAYSTIVGLINKYLRPRDNSTLLRIVLEKPFGQDQKSAEKLGNEILKYFKEDELYRVDHYLGKQTVDELWKFRVKNHKRLERIWNDQFIESIEIVMKEANDCKGRTEFYDEYGVVLDVMQNHLTEVLARILMENSGDNQRFDQLRLKSLSKIASPGPDMIVTGQYRDYAKHVMEDKNAIFMNRSSTPTLAAAVLRTSQTGWENILIFLMSGKQLNEKSVYVKINFKASYIFDSSSSESFHGDETKQSFLKFYIHSSKHDGPAIEVQYMKDLMNLEFSSSWHRIISEDNYMVLKPTKVTDAYVTLIDKIYEGERSYFVQFDSMIEAWRIWDPLQLAIKTGKIPVMIYDIKQSKKPVFRYEAITKTMNWCENETVASLDDDFDTFSPDGNFRFSSVSHKTFLGSELMMGSSEYLAESLSSDIIKGVNEAASGNNAYHIALPGGNSIKPLLTKLCQSKSKIYTDNLHIWIVDERCVALNHTHSNFKLIYDGLAKCLQIPYYNIHAMPVGIGKNLCKDQNLKYYEQEIKSWIPSMKFDMVILGLGADGHVASLFPGDGNALYSRRPLIITDKGPANAIPMRMSMSFELINSAKRIAVIAIGNKKRKIISLLKVNNNPSTDLPVLFLRKDFSSVSWFIDDTAFGNQTDSLKQN